MVPRLTHAWAIEEANLLSGMTQGVVVLGITANGEAPVLKLQGPITRADLRREGDGLSSRVPVFELKEDQWTGWARDTWAVPRLPRDRVERTYTLEVLDRLAKLPRLSDEEHPLTNNERQVRVRVGEIDQTLMPRASKLGSKASAAVLSSGVCTSPKAKKEKCSFAIRPSEPTSPPVPVNANLPCGWAMITPPTALDSLVKPSSMLIKNGACAGPLFPRGVFLGTA